MLYYSDYLGLDNIINSLNPVTDFPDEKLFITIHQVYEIWFRQILGELDNIINIFKQEKIDDNNEDLVVSVRYLKRINEIWKVLIAQINILETMTPLDFLDFRQALNPASGFQSIQFKLIEAKLGLGDRHEPGHYKHTNTGGLSIGDRDKLDQTESGHNLRKLIIKWLERLDQIFLTDFQEYPKLWQLYENKYQAMLANDSDKDSLSQDFNSKINFNTANVNDFSNAAYRSTLLINLLRDYPLFRLPFELITALTEMDEYISIWRFRHLIMVMRMIGKRIGTGGHSKDYLEGTLKKNKFFGEFTDVSSYIISRHALNEVLEANQGFLNRFKVQF